MSARLLVLRVSLLRLARPIEIAPGLILTRQQLLALGGIGIALLALHPPLLPQLLLKPW